jgi:hypothetical protein
VQYAPIVDARVLFFLKWDGMIANKPRDSGAASASSGAERR